MKKLAFAGLLSCLALIIASCSSLKVACDYDRSIDFTKYKTFEYYGWAKESDRMLNDLDKRRIEDAFGNEFKKRGLTYVKADGDLVVTLLIVVEQKTETTAYTDTYGGRGYYGGYYGHGPGWGWGSTYSTTTVSSYDYNVGTLVCDIFDKAEKKLIWEGIGSKTIDENLKNREKNIPVNVAAIMKQYPVPAPESK